MSVPSLSMLLNDKGAYARQAAAVALWRIDGATNIIPLLIHELSQTADRTREASILKAFCEMGPAASAAAPTILAKYKPRSGSAIDQIARESLVRIDPETTANTNLTQ